MAHVRKRNGKKGLTFTITASLGYDEKGQQIRKFTTFKPPDGITPGKAEKLTNEYAVLWEERIRGYVALDENRTFRELVDWYYDQVAPSILKESVRRNSRNLLEVYVLPPIGNVKLKNITPQMLDSLFHELLTNGRKRELFRLRDVHALDGKKRWLTKEGHIGSCAVPWRLARGKTAEKETCEKIAKALSVKFSDMFEDGTGSRALAPASVTRIRKHIASVMSAAVRKEIMVRNPAAKTTPMSSERRAEVFLDENQSAMLLQALDDCDIQFKTMVSTLLLTGMRGGELCGLMWENLDLEQGVIYIKQNLVYCPAKGEYAYILQKPKTKNSERYIMIPRSLVDMFKEHKASQDEKKALCGGALFHLDMVFIGEKGGFYGEKVLYTQFKKLAKKIGLPDKIHIHGLRHTTASLLINGGVSAKAVSDQLGHANTTITNDLYAHIFASSKVKSMQVLELALLNGSKTNDVNGGAAPDDEEWL